MNSFTCFSDWFNGLIDGSGGWTWMGWITVLDGWISLDQVMPVGMQVEMENVDNGKNPS